MWLFISLVSIKNQTRKWISTNLTNYRIFWKCFEESFRLKYQRYLSSASLFILYYTKLYHTILYYTILCCTIKYSSVVYYTTLSQTILSDKTSDLITILMINYHYNYRYYYNNNNNNINNNSSNIHLCKICIL